MNITVIKENKATIEGSLFQAICVKEFALNFKEYFQHQTGIGIPIAPEALIKITFYDAIYPSGFISSDLIEQFMQNKETQLIVNVFCNEDVVYHYIFKNIHAVNIDTICFSYESIKPAEFTVYFSAETWERKLGSYETSN